MFYVSVKFQDQNQSYLAKTMKTLFQQTKHQICTIHHLVHIWKASISKEFRGNLI